MTDQWQYQIRIVLEDGFAEPARHDPDNAALKPLANLLIKHHATMRCQFDAFTEYVAKAEKQGAEEYPLYEWTKATISDATKKEKHLRSFTLYVHGNEVYPREAADALELDLQPMVGGLIKQISKYDTNPDHNPQPPEHYRKQEA